MSLWGATYWSGSGDGERLVEFELELMVAVLLSRLGGCLYSAFRSRAVKLVTVLEKALFSAGARNESGKAIAGF